MHDCSLLITIQATSKEPADSNASVITFDSYAPSIQTVLSEAGVPSFIENTPSVREDPSGWRASLKRVSIALSMTSTSSRTTTGKRPSVSDDGWPKTPKAAKLGFDTSSIRSKDSTRSTPLKKSVSVASCLCLPSEPYLSLTPRVDLPFVSRACFSYGRGRDSLHVAS